MSTALRSAAGARERISALLARKRNYQQEIQQLIARHRYVVFYGCGAILDSIVETWMEYVGRPIDYTCDSNPEKWGKTFGGARCLSPRELLEIKDECAVFVTIGQFRPVLESLKENGVAWSGLIYKYDLVNSAFLREHGDGEVADTLWRTRQLLADERSVQVFDTILTRAMGDDSDPGLMADLCEPDQYFPAGIIRLSGRESFVDIGAYDGDTVAAFVRRTQGRFDRIFAFELNPENFEHLERNVRGLPGADRIEALNLGAWDSEQDVTFNIGKSQSTIGQGDGHGHVVRLDDVLAKERVSFVKMDVEGAEPHVLRGARALIQSQRPRLAVCVYHHISHLWEIPLYIKELVPEYRIYLRHHSPLEYETVCYAVPPWSSETAVRE
jgi:FkbM family methyltransferase